MTDASAGWPLRGRAAVAPAADAEERRRVLDRVRLDDDEPVLPDGPVHLRAGPPVCDFRSTMKVVTPSPGIVFTTFHAYAASALATYSSSGVLRAVHGIGREGARGG